MYKEKLLRERNALTLTMRRANRPDVIHVISVKRMNLRIGKKEELALSCEQAVEILRGKDGAKIECFFAQKIRNPTFSIL